MKRDAGKAQLRLGKDQRPGGPPLRLAAIGLEAEFELAVDGRRVRPEDLFRDPRDFLGPDLIHRTGRSYSMPNGAAVYFDTGVIEVATPVIEIERRCAERAGRSLWESIRALRRGLDAWERRTGRSARLIGFSAHYNISFERPDRARSVERLARLLAFVLPVPAMLLAANRRSTGIGVRPRGDRVEITADFTPSAALTIGMCAFVTAVIREAMHWPSYGHGVLAREGIPVIVGYAPMKHTSRQGWLARKDCYPADPFALGPDSLWATTTGSSSEEVLSLRDIGARIARRFAEPLEALAGRATARFVHDVLTGAAPSLLDLPDRPPEYEDVGRGALWDDLFPERALRRSRYERALIRAIAGVPLRVGGETYTPTGLEGWSAVAFRDARGGRHVFSMDYLLTHLDRWERRPRRGL